MYCINYVIQKGDTLYSVSRHFNIPLQALIEANPMVNVYHLLPGEIICVPVSIPSNNYSHYTTYLIEEGDTMGSILKKHNVNLADVMQLNNLDDIYLQPGTTIQMPIIDENDDNITL
ncbi:LysM peptidoglycan-binding domain-containing protein [Lachnospiraceae bacterium MD1]|jgi:LysM repeat protein|uniref:LysM peptidoglycan-binding domain-containing protein n=1 Tax=Variimorphobacter saccharofermentans TaxID=2755051 RepID=A0A839K258_9FIRM|nr:LysM peptidoglycan-binding domain-containing protein [Variimorphobacter saccharofermentans]MBB2183690.1 LysM peptidoglycan-binding domain-containing protein [Variimorphobacter saccharofermentans]